MGVDAVAILPLPPDPLVEIDEGGGWATVIGPGGAVLAARRVRDAVLVNLGLPIGSPDADLYEASAQWSGRVPARVWVFPDTAVPDVDTAAGIRAATAPVGRWVRPGVLRRSALEELGLTRAEADAWQRDVGSGDPDRVKAARDRLAQLLADRDPAEVEALIAASLKR